MKVALSSYWRKNYIFMSVVVIFMITMAIRLLSVSNPNNDKWIIGLAVSYIGMFLFLTLKSYRFMTYVKIHENEIESYIFNKRLCKVCYDKVVYYVIFDARESSISRKKYIAVSNKRFEYQETSGIRLLPSDNKPFLGSYDVKKQIVIPYDEKIISILPIEKWYMIG